jgi:hypothetical protein
MDAFLICLKKTKTNKLNFSFGCSFCHLKKRFDIHQESILPNFFLRKAKIFPFFAIKLGCSIEKGLFSYVTNTQAKQ